MSRPAWFGSEPDIIIAARKRIALAKRRRRVASADRSPEGGDRETGRHAKHESAVAANSSETPNLSAEGDS